MEDRIINEESIENKIFSLRELLKILFNLGVLKLNKKKSTIEELDNLKKDIGFTPIMMIQSKLSIIFNNVVKGINIIMLR